MTKKYFFGWRNVKRLITELLKILSRDRSFFSKKRIESSLSFIIGQAGMITWFITSIIANELSIFELSGWAVIEFGIAGYVIDKIEKNKKLSNNEVTKEISN